MKRGGSWTGIRRVLRIREVGQDLDDEIAFHLERTVEELMEERGWTRARAEREAARRFGDERYWRRTMERLDRRAAAWRRWAGRVELAGLGLRHALRRIRRAPGFTAAVVLTFALGIGANATMFGIVDRLLLSPPAHIEDADGVRRIYTERFIGWRGTRELGDAATYPDLLDYESVDGFEAVAGVGPNRVTVGRGETAEQLETHMVTGGFFRMLGVRPALGRLFGPESDVEGEHVAVLGHGLWQRMYGGDPNVLGQTLDFGYGPYTIIGVAPEGFTGTNLEPVHLWLPLVPAATHLRGPNWKTSRNWYWVRVFARLAPDVTPAAAEAEATAVHRAARAEQIEADRYDPDVRVVAAPLIAARGPKASEESMVARWLAAISLIVLLIACANVANLLLARSVLQRRETGIRLALGSSRARLLGHVLLDSLALAGLGGAAALLVAKYGGSLVRGVLLPNVLWIDAALDPRLVGVVAGFALLAGALAGLVPAVQSSRPSVAGALRAGGRTVASRGSRTRDALTVLQAALSVVLLVGAGLFVRSLTRVEAMDMGFDPEPVLFAEPIIDRDVDPAVARRAITAARDQVAALPGVEAVSVSVGVPFWSSWAVTLEAPDLDSIPTLPTGSPTINAVDPDYFRAMDLRIVRGRALQTDTEAGPREVVINETMARVLWPGQEALGKCLVIESDDAACSAVVGIVEDSRRDLIVEEETMQYFVPFALHMRDERPEGMMVRVRGDDPEAMTAAVRAAMLSADPALRYAEVRPLAELIDPQARAWRLGAAMFSVFGLLALVVAGVGLYSVLAFSVAQRTFEIGIRAALGASREGLVALVLRHALLVVLLGVALGLAAALIAAPRIAPLLFQTSPRDPVTLVAVVAVLLGVAVAASAVPALRATRVDPARALRSE